MVQQVTTLAVKHGNLDWLIGTHRERTEWWSWGKNGVGEQWKRYVKRGSHYVAREKPDAKEITRDPQGVPQLRSLATSERVPKLAFPCNQVGDYPIITELSSSNGWKQIQRPTSKHKTKLPESIWREGGKIIWASRVKVTTGKSR